MERDKGVPGPSRSGGSGASLGDSEEVEPTGHDVDGRAKTGERNSGSGVCVDDTGGVDWTPLPPREQGVRR